MPDFSRGTQEDNGQTSMKILQININHCEVAHDLLMQTVRELKLVTTLCQVNVALRPSVHWWNKHISALLIAEYKKARRSLNKAIKNNKKNCCKKLR